MKISQTVPALVLGLAATVTAGSVYITVQAAQQQADAIPLPTIMDEDVPTAMEVAPAGNMAAAEDVMHSRGHYLAIDASGTLNGRLLTLDSYGAEGAGGLTVKIIKDGSEIVRTTTDSDGTFTATGLTDGTVALLAYGADQFLLYAVNLRRDDQAKELAIQDIGMTSAVVSGANATLAKQLVNGSVQPQEWRFQDQATEHDHSFPNGAKATPSTAVSHHQIQLGADGSLEGQINLLDPRTGRHQVIQDLTLHFLKDGSVIGSTQVSSNGAFRMDGLEPGIHAVVTTGRDGVLALGIDLLAANFADNADSQYKLASVAQTLDLSVAPVTYRNYQPEFIEDNFESIPGDIITDIAPLPAPFGPGGFGGGGFSGGGGGFGGGGGGFGGGLGALAGVAGALGGFAIADDDDSPSSPAR